MRINRAHFGEELSASDVRTALYSALEAIYPDTVYGGCSAYIVDYFPDSKQVIFQYSGDSWRQSYELSETGEAKLEGMPEKVVSRTVYEVAEMGEVELTTFGDSEGDYLPWESPIFECGHYEAQGVDARNPNYLDQMVANFKGAKFKNSHKPDPQSVFSRVDLGGCDKIRREGTTLIGTGIVHRAVKALVGTPKASIEIFDKIARPTLGAIALLNFPQVKTAHVAAFEACFAGSRHSKADMEAIQRIHDLAVEQGATCAPATEPVAELGDPDPARATLPTAKEKSMSKPTVWGRLAAVLGIEKVTSLGTEEQVNAIFADSTVETDPVLAAQIATFEEERRISRTLRLSDEAASFANKYIYGANGQKPVAFVKDFDAIKGMFLNAAVVDGKDGVATFGDDGKVVVGDEIKRLTAFFEGLDPLPALMGGKIADRKPDDSTIGSAEVTKARLASSVNAYNRGGN